jgi:hypothetical protein
MHDLLRPILKRTCWLLFAALFVVLPSIAQSDASHASPTAAAKSPDEMKALLAEAYSRNALEALSGPYHLLATFHTFTLDGSPAGDGSIMLSTHPRHARKRLHISKAGA